MRKKGITAAELLARLNADPEWVAARAKEEEERQKRAEDFRRAEKPLADELKAAGFNVDSAWDLMNKSASYPAALPILLKHLPRSYPPRVREGIARALAVPDAKFAWDTLVAQFRSDKVEDAKDGMAVAIAAISDDSLIGDVIGLLRDRSLGSSRVLLLSALEKSKKPEARAVIAELESDPDLHVEARNILHRLAKRKKKPRFGPNERPEFLGAEAEKYATRHLRKIRTDIQTWQTFLEDKQTGEKWAMDYPQSSVPGMGGLARLRKIGDP